MLWNFGKTKRVVVNLKPRLNEGKVQSVLGLSQGIQVKVSSVRIVWRMYVKKQNEEKSAAAMFVDATLANNDGSSMTVRSKVG